MALTHPCNASAKWLAVPLQWEAWDSRPIRLTSFDRLPLVMPPVPDTDGQAPPLIAEVSSRRCVGAMARSWGMGKPIRQRRAANDQRVARACDTIAHGLGIPGAKIVSPDGKPYHGNVKLGTVRSDWDSETSGKTCYQRTRRDSRIGTAEREAERIYGLPVGSVHIFSGTGRNIRSDKFVGSHRQQDG